MAVVDIEIPAKNLNDLFNIKKLSSMVQEILKESDSNYIAIYNAIMWDNFKNLYSKASIQITNVRFNGWNDHLGQMEFAYELKLKQGFEKSQITLAISVRLESAFEKMMEKMIGKVFPAMQ